MEGYAEYKIEPNYHKKLEAKYKIPAVKTLGERGFKYMFKNSMCEIDKILRKRLNYDIKAVVNSWDLVYAVTGMEGSGKSMSGGLGLATYFSWFFRRDFTLDNVVFTPEQFEDRVDKSSEYEVIMWDEFMFGGSSDDLFDDVQKTLKKTFTVIRDKKLIIILVMPYFHMMSKYWAVARTRALININSPDGVKRGTGKFYGYKKKKFAYVAGKRNMDLDKWKYDFDVQFLDLGNPEVTGEHILDPVKYREKKHGAREQELQNMRNKKEHVYETKWRTRYYDFAGRIQELHEYNNKQISELSGMTYDQYRKGRGAWRVARKT